MDRKHEQGFILVTSLVILTILGISAAAMSYKTITETKVAASTTEKARAFEAARAGLAQNYQDWQATRVDEKNAIAHAVVAGSPTQTGIYDQSLHPSSITDIGKTAAEIDKWVKNHANIRVFDVTPNGLVAGTWGKGSYPQVALWASGFKKAYDPAYPYSTPATGACSDCSVAVYALGRFGRARSLQREIQMTATHRQIGITAITNAPTSAYWSDLCAGKGSTPTSIQYPFGVTGEHNPQPPATSPTVNHDWMIEATQAEYRIYANPALPNLVNVPSGVAFASNTSVGVGNTEFKAQFPLGHHENVSTTAVYDNDPIIAYSGHHSVTTMRADYASTTRDMTSPNAPDMPSGKLPHKLVNKNLLGSNGQLNLFDGTGQAFDLDAVRWAAEQLTCNDNGVPSGKFCAKAKALKQRLIAAGIPAQAPVTGRMTLAEFQYNVANAIPMFGIVRVMYPATAVGGSEGSGTCNSGPVQLYKTEDGFEKFKWSKGAGDYDGTPTTVDSDGKLGSKAKLLVYGSIMLDFFSDDDSDGLFDPASGEHVLSNVEAGEVKVEMRVPILVNPAMPEAISGSMRAFPGISMDGSGPVNLASPTGGNFPSSEGLIPTNAATGPNFTAQKDGRMTLMAPDGSGVSRLFALGDSARVNRGLPTAAADVLFQSYKTRLKYYYDLLVATTDTANPNEWPIAAFPGSMSDNFCIGELDCAAPPAGTGPNNDGDKFHLLYPSGYMHGWKVALAALRLTADDWNHILDGANTLASQAVKDSTPAHKGSPLGAADVPAGFSSLAAKAADLATINANEHRYFYAETGNGGWALLTGAWADVPAVMYAGGYMAVQYTANVSGALYTPGPMSWGAEDATDDPGTGYFAGAIITGFGFSRGSEDGHGDPTYSVVVFDPTAVDNANINPLRIFLNRYAWEQVR